MTYPPQSGAYSGNPGPLPPQATWQSPTAAPGYGYSQGVPGGMPMAPPSPHFGWGVAALLFFWPLCIPSFIAASKVSSAVAMGDMATAYKASADAKKWGRMGVIVGAGLGFLTLAITIVSMVTLNGY